MNSLRVLLHSAIAYPLMDDKGEVLGVLYADRGFRSDFGDSSISDEEQRLIEILAAGITAGILKSKQEQLVTKYQQFFSPKITEAIRRNPSLLAGEETNVTVLFCDIRGFSRIADKIGSAEAMKWVSDTLSELSQIVLDLDGVLVDYVGDEMFAMWGAPEASEIHAFQAASAARLMMSRRAELSNRWRGLIPEGVDFGIGLCTGAARVGNTGSKQKFKYGPMGRTVNLGSRIQGLTKQWRVGTLIDGVTQANLPGDMLCRRLASASVVGLDGTLELHELMPDNSDNSKALKEAYEAAYTLFECGTKPREAVRAFGEVVQRFPLDGPSLLMLVRSVNELVEPTMPFSPVWTATTK
jgi:adenylate cyclase